MKNNTVCFHLIPVIRNHAIAMHVGLIHASQSRKVRKGIV